jgi:hypothetical protein
MNQCDHLLLLLWTAEGPMRVRTPLEEDIIAVLIMAGVDVMVTIFCDFRQFLGKKIGVFLKNQCYDQNFA